MIDEPPFEESRRNAELLAKLSYRTHDVRILQDYIDNLYKLRAMAVLASLM